MPIKEIDWTNCRKIAGGVLGVVCGILISIQSPPQDLSVEAMLGMGIIAWAIIYWIFDVLPEFVTALLMCCSWVIFKVVPFNVGFAQFANTNWWLLVGALGIGVAVSGSGLLKRLALLIMRLFPPTYKGQVLGLLLAGVGIAPTIPSVTAKAAIMAPLSLAMSDTMGYERKSQGAAGLFSAMFTGFVCTGPIFISASFICYMVRGFLPEAVQAQFAWMQWFFSAALWGLVLIVGSYYALLFLYKPEHTKLEPGFIEEQLAQLGPMKRNERITLVVLILTLLFWMGETIHGVSSALVALVSLCVLLGFKVYERQDFRTGIPWDSIIFIGCLINLTTVLPYLKIDQWIGEVIAPIIIPMMVNPYLFITVLVISIYLLRFVFVSMTATLTIMLAVLIPIASQQGINPWIVAIIGVASTNVWNVYYQNSTYLTAYYATGGVMVNHSQAAKMSAAYMLISLIGFLVSIPFWQLLGLIQ
jgi:anion transporter